MFLPADVNHKQHGNNSRFQENRANRVPALLSCYGIDAVPSDQAALVFEDEGGQFEQDSVVIPLVSQRMISRRDRRVPQRRSNPWLDSLPGPIRTALMYIHIVLQQPHAVSGAGRRSYMESVSLLGDFPI